MNRCLHTIDRITSLLGYGTRWLSLFMVIATCGVVLLRYGFDQPSIALQEAVLYCHAALFMIGASYTWQQGGHVRVDIFYRSWPIRRKKIINVLGIIIFVLPVTFFLLYSCWEYVANAWRIKETSPEASGLPFVYGLKTLLIIMPALIILQSIAELIRLFSNTTGRITHPATHTTAHTTMHPSGD